MAQIIVRGLEEDIRARLQRRAARHGRSMAAEARDILRDALKAEDDVGERGLGTGIADLFKGIGLDPHEEIKELRGSFLACPFEE